MVLGSPGIDESLLVSARLKASRLKKTLNGTITFVLVAIALVSSATQGAEPGDYAPEVSLPALANGSDMISLEDYRGQVVYLDFWASWCGPCRLSFPELERLYQGLRSQGFTVLAVNVDEASELAFEFLQKYPASFPVLHDPVGDTPRRYGIKGMPTAFILDREGRVLYVHEGFRKGDGQEIERLLTEAILK